MLKGTFFARKAMLLLAALFAGLLTHGQLNDAGVSAIVSPIQNNCAGVANVELTIKNFGTNTILGTSGAYKIDANPQVNWAYSLNLAAGDDTTLLVGTTNLVAGSSHSIKAWTTNPNSATDPNNTNDTTIKNGVLVAHGPVITVGGASPNFATIQAAMTALSTYGVCGPTTVNIRNGAYIEKVQVKAIPNASPVNSVTVQSENQDSTLVIIESSAGVPNYAVNFNGATYVTFQLVTLRRTGAGTSNSSCVLIDGNSHNVTFRNSIMTGYTAGGVSTQSAAMVYLDNTLDTAVTIENNRINGGAYGVSRVNGNTLSSGLIIKNNYITSWYRGIQLYDYSNSTITENRITSDMNGAYSSYFGIFVDDMGSNNFITKNKINLQSGNTGLYLSDMQGSVNSKNVIANNFIRIGPGNASVYGIRTQGFCNYNEIVYNNINIDNNGSNTYGLLLSHSSAGTGNLVFNNNVSMAAGNAFQLYLGFSVLGTITSDYNNFHNSSAGPGAVSLYDGSSTYGTVAAWNSATSFDANSISVDPAFTSNTDLHSYTIDLFQTGTPIPSVTDDIDGEPRSGTTPTIGADEFVLPPVDAGIAKFSSPITACPGVTNFSVELKNFGTDTLKNVVIQWEVNGAPQVGVNYTNPPLAPGETAIVPLGNYNLSSGVPYDFKSYTQNPNSGPDGNNINDTFEVLGFQTSILGTFTIGGSSPDFATFADAVTFINTNGVCGPVIFNVRPGSYNEQISIEALGTSTTNTVTFQAENGDSSSVVLATSGANSAANYTVRVTNSGNIIFRNMTIGNNSVSYTTALLVEGSVNGGIEIHNCELRGVQTTSTLAAVIQINANGNHNFKVDSTFFNSGAYAVYFPTNSPGDTGFTFNNNIVTGIGREGLRIAGLNGLEMINNYIENAYAFGYVVDLVSCSGKLIIKKNNLIGLIGSYGLALSSCTGSPGNFGEIFNNMISSAGTNTYHSVFLSGTTDYHYFYHNTIVSSSSNANCYALNNTATSTNLYFMNNIFANMGGGPAVLHSSTVNTHDYNDFYVANNSVMGRYASIAYNTIQAWRSGTGKDGNSVSINPNFVSSSDFHATSGGVNDNGFPLTFIATDFDDEPRSSTNPDIGADEFTPPPNDIGVIGLESPAEDGCDMTGQTEVCIWLYNFGSAPQWGFSVNMRVYTAVLIGAEIVTDTIHPGDSLMYCFTNKQNFSAAGTYPLRPFSDLSNDANRNNDTALSFILNNGIISTFPYCENFDGTGGNIPLKWFQEDNPSNEEWRFTNTGIVGGPTGDHTTGLPSGYYMWMDDSNPASTDLGIQTVCLDLSSMAAPAMEFWYWNAATPTSANLYIDVFEQSTHSWQQIAGPLGHQDPNKWKYHIYGLSAYIGQSVKIRFRATEVGGSLSSDIGIDDFCVFDQGVVNMSVTEILSPESGCGLGTTEIVKIIVQNVGLDSVTVGTNLDLYYNVDGGTAIYEQFLLPRTLHQYDTIHYTFIAPVDLSVAGTYDITTWISYFGDNYPANDTSSILVESKPLVSNYPYSIDFENGPQGWSSGGTSNTWVLDVPSGAVISSAGSGLYAWVTNSIGVHNLSENSYVESPCYDFTTLKEPQMSFYMNRNIANADGANVHYSTDGGDTWTLLGGFPANGPDKQNWYNDNSVFPLGNEPGWNSTGSGWENVKHDLAVLAGEQNVIFRVRFASGTFPNPPTTDGFAFDDFVVGEKPNIGMNGDTINDCGYVTLTAKNPGAFYTWSTGAITQTITVNAGAVPSSAFYAVTVTTPEGLTNSDSVLVNLNPGPQVNLGNDTLICDQPNYVLDAENTGATYLWDDNSSNQTRTVSTDGDYFVTVSALGCNKTDTINVTFDETPVPSFIPTQQTPPQQYLFTNTSTGGGAFLWDFGNGVTSTQTNPTHYFTTSGIHKVTLTVTNPCGSVSKDTTIHINVGLETVSSYKVFSISPNPTSGKFILDIETENLSDLKIKIIDMRGRVVIEEVVDQTRRLSRTFDIAHLQSGIYTVEVSGDNGIISGRLIKN